MRNHLLTEYHALVIMAITSIFQEKGDGEEEETTMVLVSGICCELVK